LSGTSHIPVRNRPFEKEFEFISGKSQGPGGQHVNKTETRIDLKFHVENSNLLSEEEKLLLQKKLKHKINSEGFLVISAQEYRSQLMNKNLTIKRFFSLVEQHLKKRKKRIPSRPSRASVQKRLERKKRHGEKKVRRSKFKV
jgi:ribosome-associated protein